MDHFRGITAEIVSNGQVLKLYDDPDAPEIEESLSRHHYVEAVAGSTFQVKVNLTPQFNFCEMNAKHAVKVVVKVDGRGDSALTSKRTKRELQEDFAEKQSSHLAFTGPRQFCKENAQWMWIDYSFGDLVLKESSNREFSVQQAQHLGVIQVTVTRVKVGERVPYVPSREPIAIISEVPEKALKGRPIETTIGFANAHPAPAPPAELAADQPLSGGAGKPVVFNIYYRSRRALQMMGCIPRSPSPESQSPDDKSAAPEDVVKEVQDLRARLALLERDLNVKPESSSASNRLKRERDEEGNEGPRQRRRTSVKIEHIDLTGD